LTETAVAAIRSGEAVILPTDTVYGLCATPYAAEACLRLYALKDRPGTQPTALMASDVDMLFECVPELRGRAGTIARALLPGPFTLVLPNPAHRYRWITGDTPDKIGVRVAELPDAAAPVLERVGAVAATSANLRGGREPRRLEDVPAELREAAAVVVDGGELPGVGSTVVDASGPEPVVLREGAVPADDALARIRAAVA
jgi:tRNA threonylcarbamoyl adenosine modification protein (Sua5/YciO/YrdC/YwlC family)